MSILPVIELAYDGSEGPGGGDLSGEEGQGVGVGGEGHPLRGRGFLETVTTEDPYPVTEVVTATIHSCRVPLNMTTSDFDNIHNVICGRAMTMMSACHIDLFATCNEKQQRKNLRNYASSSQNGMLRQRPCGVWCLVYYLSR